MSLDYEVVAAGARTEIVALRERITFLEAIIEAAAKLNGSAPAESVEEPKPPRRRPGPKPGEQNGTLEGKVLAAIEFEPLTKKALAGRFNVQRDAVDKVLAKLRAEGEVEPTGRGSSPWRRV